MKWMFVAYRRWIFLTWIRSTSSAANLPISHTSTRPTAANRISSHFFISSIFFIFISDNIRSPDVKNMELARSSQRDSPFNGEHINYVYLMSSLLILSLFSFLLLLFFILTRSCCSLILFIFIIFLLLIALIYNILLPFNNLLIGAIPIETISEVEHQVDEILIVSCGH